MEWKSTSFALRILNCLLTLASLSHIIIYSFAGGKGGRELPGPGGPEGGPSLTMLKSGVKPPMKRQDGEDEKRPGA